MQNTQDNISGNLIVLNAQNQLDQNFYLEPFADFLLANGASQKTKQDYQNDIKIYLAWLRQFDIHDPKEVGFLTVQKFRDHLLKFKKPATVNRQLTSLRKFYGWLGKPDLVSKTRVQMIDEVKPAPKSLTASEWAKIDRSADRHADKDHYLSCSIIRLMRYAGLRVSEVCLLNLEDLICHSRSGKVTIKRGKGLKSREIPLVKEVCDVLNIYLDHRENLTKRWQKICLQTNVVIPPETKWPTGRVFLSQRGAFTPNGLYRLVENIGNLAKIKLHPHMLRHTFAKALVDPKRYGFTKDAAPLSAIKQLMGHSNIQTTSVYLLHSDEDLEKILNGQ